MRRKWRLAEPFLCVAPHDPGVGWRSAPACILLRRPLRPLRRLLRRGGGLRALLRFARVSRSKGCSATPLCSAARPLGRSIAHAETLLAPQKESTLHLVLRLRGGAKKRKKKTYTKPKKNKHKRKKTKLAFLAFYKVDDSGKVTRLRKECPAPECGAGVFMANHFDRHYCGRCGLTFTYEAEAVTGGKGGKGGKGKK
jgi:ribosomal protein S27AE